MRVGTIFAAFLVVTSCAVAQQNLLPNPSFEEGAEAPEGWAPADESATWSDQHRTGARALAVIGDGTDTTYWRTDDPGLEPGGLYEFSVWMRRADGSGGSAITGPSFANRDVGPGEEWTRTAHVFRVPDGDQEGYVRVGHWHASGTLLFDDAGIVPVNPVPIQREGLALGEGESIAEGRYSFRAPAAGYAGNYSRCLQRHTAGFNTHRWVFFPGAEVVYRHNLPGITMTAATVEVAVGWHAAGECIVEASADGEAWSELGTIGEVATGYFDVPEALLPADALWVRMRSAGAGERGEDSAPGSFQVYQYSLQAELGEEVASLTGETTFLVEETRSERLAVEPEIVATPAAGGAMIVRANLRKLTAEPLTAKVTLEVSAEAMRTEVSATIPLGDEQLSHPLVYMPNAVGSHEAAIVVTDAAGDELYRATFTFTVPELHRADFGYAISSDDATDLWWCEGTYKVSRERMAPLARVPEISVEAARGEYEPVQVVLRPKQEMRGLTASMGDLTELGGETIPGSAVEMMRVGYVYVHTPTDAQGAVGWWPDPLPPLDEPIDLQADQNQPLWLRVHVPREATPGQYRGTLTLSAEGWQAEVPLNLRVYDFVMPEERSVVATMGFSTAAMRTYHHLQTDEQMATAFDAYMRNFREHRIDPYAPWLSGPRVELVGVAWDGGETVATDAPEGEHALRVVDDSDTGNPSAAATAPIEVDRERAYTLSFMARAEQGHEFMTTLACHDAQGQWMSGRNIDTVHTGAGDWQRYTAELPAGRIAEGCTSLRLSLRPTRWREPGITTGTVIFDDISLAAEGNETNLVPDGGFEGGPEGARIEVDFSEWDPWLEKYVDGLGFQSFRLPISYMPRRDAPGRVGPYEQGTQAYDRIVGEYLHTLQEHLREKGWLDAAYAYWVDEPEPDHYENVAYGMRLLDQYAPEIRRMLTEQPEEALFAHVDIWCPVLHNYEEEAARARQAEGEEIWWYVCTGPKAPWAGLFTDHNAIDLRIWQWMTWKYDVTGALIWTTNYWNSPQRQRETGRLQNPWEDPMSYRSSGGGWWGNGDGRFIYPPNVDPNAEHEPIVTGPIDSIRWEMLREGLEDYEYFHALAQRIEGRDKAQARALLTIPESIITSPREFTRDARMLYQHRRALLEELERIGE